MSINASCATPLAKAGAGQGVAVAVSGGMDSLLSVALLQEAGYRVEAFHARFLPSDEAATAMIGRLRRQCEKLGVPLHMVEAQAEFEREVIAPFLRAHEAGRTPNPCAFCNPRMKFGLLRRLAAQSGLARFATGHYARFCRLGEDEPCLEGGESRLLFPAADGRKNQVYFLSLVAPDAFSNVIFPLGGLHKTDVPALLRQRGLDIPQPRESQEICFIPHDDYRAFLQAAGAALGEAGDICLEDGTVLGRHNGLWNYTEGQRKGLGLAWKEPLYVIAKDHARQVLHVGPKERARARGCVVGQMNFFVPPAHWPEAFFAQLRYRQRPQPVRVEAGREGEWRLTFPDGVDLSAPGQVATLSTPAGHVLAGGCIHSFF